MKRSNFGLILFLLIIIIGLVVYIGYDKMYSFRKDSKVEDKKEIQEKDEDKEEDKFVEIDVNNEMINTLLGYTNPYGYNCKPFMEKYESDSFLVKDMSEEYKLMLISKMINYANSSVIPEYVIKNAYETVFGSGTYSHLDKLKADCSSYTFDFETKTFSKDKTSDVCGCTSGPGSPINIEYIIKAVRFNDRIEIDTKVGFFNNFVLYSDTKYTNEVYNASDVLGSIESYYLLSEKYEEIMRTNEDKLNTYRYTFLLDDDGFYYYNKVAKVS